MVGDEWFEDPTRLLRGVLPVDDTARRAITVAAELIWDDLLDAVETDTVTDALLIGLLPRQFRDRAAGDWRRWLATFTTVVWKLGEPAPPPPATMAEQLCVSALIGYTQTGVVDLARDGMVRPRRRRRRRRPGVVGRGVPRGRRPRALIRPGVGRHRRRHHGSPVRVRADGLRGHVRRLQRTQRHLHRRAAPAGAAAHDAPEWDDEQRLQRAVGSAAAPVARAAVADAARIHLADDGVDVELVAHRVGSLLGLQLRPAAPTTIELVGPVDAATRDRLAGWLDHNAAS